MDPSAPFPEPISVVDPADVATIAAVDSLAAIDANPPTHPPYAEMICAAIVGLKERDGSSKRAIAKFIDEAYSGLPLTHSALLTTHLKRLKNSGVLVMVKKSYKLAPPRSDGNGGSTTEIANLAGDAFSGPKRGRGRPPKPKDSAQLDSAQPDPARPVLAALGLVDEYTERRAPGRPRKSVSMAAIDNGGPGPVAPKKRPGRPPGRRPKTIASMNGKRRPGRPTKAQSVPLIVPYSTADIPKPRGRPKLLPIVVAAAGNGGVKRRGRPPKVAGEVKKIKKGTGKSPGRPRKNAIVPRPTSDAAVELKRKLEYLQSKVMQVVGVLKPQLTSQSSISTITAVQELEGLAAMDISAPLPVEALVQVPVQLQIPIQPPLLQNTEPFGEYCEATAL